MTLRTNPITENPLFRPAWAVLTLALGFALMTPLAAVAETRMSATYDRETSVEAPTIEVGSNLDMRDDGYNDDYIFGMTKGVANSTMVPAIKPLFFLVTIPLDLALLPLAAIGGFF